MSELPQEAVEAAVNATGRRNNPKWDHPITGYQTFSDDQKEHLRERARAALAAAAPVVIHYGDSESHARSFNEGYEAAVTQGLADDPALANEWLDERLRQALREAADELESDASLRPTERAGAMHDVAHWLRARADRIEAPGE